MSERTGTATPPASGLPLAGKAALVTGGGSGIGLACAQAFLRDGASVTITGRTATRLEEAAAQLRAAAPAGATVQHLAGSVTDEDAVAAAVALAAEPHGGLHIAVANAGVGGLGPVVTLSLEEWNTILGTNLTGTFLVFKHAGAEIARSGGGAMLATSSIAAAVTHPFMAPYAVSKAGIDMLVRNTADELGAANVRVNSVRPGLVETDLVAPAVGDEHIMTSYLDAMPLRRIGQVEDVAKLVTFLCGPDSTWITGVSVSVDGGHHLRVGPDFGPITRALFGDEAADGIVPGS